MPKTSLTATAALGFLAAAALAAPVAANTIGAVSALNKDVDGTPPQEQPRQLTLGDNLVRDELIESSPIGSGQFLFLDQTTLTIAKNSVIKLDKYVYDPSTRRGEFAMTMTKGVLRFVGGRITKNTDAVVTTPTATIGIRGGMAIIIVDEDGTTRVMHIAGEYTRVTRNDDADVSILGGQGGDGVLPDGGVVISRNNGVVEVGPGAEPVYIGVADQRLISETTVALIGRGDAGEKVEPQDPDVVNSGVPESNSQRKGAQSEDPVSTTGESPSWGGRGNGGDGEDDLRFTPSNEEVTTVAGLDALPVADPLTLLPGVTGSASFSGATAPGLTSGPGGQSFVFTQVFEGSRVGVTANDEVFIIPTDTGFFSFDATEGASPVGGISGAGFFDPAAEFTYAVFQTQAGDTGAFLSGRASDPLPNAAAGTRAVRRYEISDDLFNGNGPAFTPGSVSGFTRDGQSRLAFVSNRGGAATGGDAKAVATYLQINGTGVSQTSGFGVLTARVTNGGAGTPAIDDFFEGSFQNPGGAYRRIETRVVTVEDGQGGSAFGPNAQYLALGNGDGVSGDSTAGRLITEGGGQQFFGTNNVATRRTEQQLAGAAAFSGLQGYTATTGRDLASGEAYAALSGTNTGVTMNIDAATNSGSATLRLNETFTGFDGTFLESPDLRNMTVTYGGDNGRSAVLTGDNFAMRHSRDGDFFANGTPGEPVANDPQAGQSVFRGALATASMAGDGGIFPAGVSAESEFMRWGWWAGEFRSDGTDPSGDPAVDDQRLHLGAWVAGDLTDNLPLQGVATYEGFAVISAIQDGRSFTDGAGFDLTYNFGNGLGTATFTDVLGADATIGVGQASVGNHYQGTAGINIAGQNGLISVNGSFFNAGATPAGATGGSLSIATFNGRISGAGVYAGDRTSFTPNP